MNDSNYFVYMVASFILIAVGVLAFIPVVGLAGFHCGLVCMGRTTNEHVRPHPLFF